MLTNTWLLLLRDISLVVERGRVRKNESDLDPGPNLPTWQCWFSTAQTMPLQQVITCWFPRRFKADLTAEAWGAITACPEDLWHIRENVKGVYCCGIMSLSETDRTSKTVSDVKQRSPVLILTLQWGRRWKQRTPGSDAEPGSSRCCANISIGRTVT